MVSDFGNLETLLILLRLIEDMLLFANCWSPIKTWSASIDARVFSLQNSGWLVEWFRSTFLKIYWGNSTPVTKSWSSSGPEFRVAGSARDLLRMTITLWVVLIRSLVCARCVLGCLRSGSGWPEWGGWWRWESRQDGITLLICSWRRLWFFINSPFEFGRVGTVINFSSWIFVNNN